MPSPKVQNVQLFVAAPSYREHSSSWYYFVRYDGLTQPSYSPAAWVIGPVFTFCFLLESLGAWFVWYANGIKHSYPHILIYCAQVINLTLEVVYCYTFISYQYQFHDARVRRLAQNKNSLMRSCTCRELCKSPL